MTLDRKVRKLESILYLLAFAGFFMLMMRFGCGSHVMGHNQHRSQDGDNHHEISRGSGLASGSLVHDDLPASPKKQMTVHPGEHGHG